MLSRAEHSGPDSRRYLGRGFRGHGFRAVVVVLGACAGTTLTGSGSPLGRGRAQESGQSFRRESFGQGRQWFFKGGGELLAAQAVDEDGMADVVVGLAPAKIGAQAGEAQLGEAVEALLEALALLLQ